MRSFFLLLVFTLFSITIAQHNAIDVKHDSIHKIAESDYTLVYHKGKCSVLNSKRNTFPIKNSKSFFHVFETQQTLLELDRKGKIRLYSLVDNLKSDTVYFNEARFCQDSRFGTRLLKENEPFNPELESYYGVLIQNNLAFIYEFKHYIAGDEDWIPLMTEYGGDSVRLADDGTYEVVYMDLSFPDINRSGVVSFKTKEWLLHPKYQNVDKLNGVLVASIGRKDELNSEYSFDFIKTQNGKVLDKRLGLNGFSDFSSDLFFPNMSCRQGRDSSLLYVENEEQKTLIKICLQPNTIGDGYERWEDWSYSFDFKLDTVLVGEYDWILKNGVFSNEVFYSDQGKLRIKRIDPEAYDGDRTWIEADSSWFYEVDVESNNTISVVIDGDLYKDRDSSHTDSIFYPVGKLLDWEKEIGVGVKKLGENKLYIHHFIPESKNLEVVYNEWGEDSLYQAEDGQYYRLYYPPDPGQYESGIFDVEQKRWIVAPTNSRVLYLEGGYLCEYPDLNEYYNLIQYQYKYIKFDGTILFENLDYEALIKNYPDLGDSVEEFKW